MKNNQLIAIMVAMLFVVTLLAVWYTLQGNKLNNHLQELKAQMDGANGMRSLVSVTYNEAANYSKTHPDIIPILQAMTNGNVRPVAPAVKTPGK